MASSAVTTKLTRAPRLAQLSRPRDPRGLFASTTLHVVVMAGFIWLPRLFPSAIVLPMQHINQADVADPEPLVTPALPRLEDRGSGSRESSGRAKAAGSAPTRQVAEPQPRKPDFIAPQEIVSAIPNAVNRVQTIRRPDLVAPPKLKFPMRLQSMVILPSGPAPVLNPPPEPPKQKPAPSPTASVEVPVLKPVAPAPMLVVAPQRASVIPSQTKPTPNVAPNLRVLADVQSNPAKSIVVVNAVNVAPDPGVAVPDAELAGNFVVGPSSNATASEKSAAAGAGHAAEGSPGSSTHGGVSGPDSGSGTGSGAGRTPGAGGGDHAEPGAGTGTGRGAANGSGSGNAPGAGGKSGAGGGSGPGSTPGPGSGNGSPGAGAGNGPSTGISISGGIPGRNGATVTRAVPQHHSYGMMIISGGNNGGASRDVGVFDRSETVYNVSIPMGSGPDWTLQYAVLDRAQASSGFLTPPFAEKKVPATMPKSELVADSSPVFITGVIDDHGKLHTLRAIRPQDPRSQPAIRALEQWEFLPAQMDGKPIASKVLIGVSVTIQ
jgi:hypothetical protein